MSQHALIINPNTRDDLTASLLAQIGNALPGVTLMGATAPFGDGYIASEQSYVVAAHAVLDAWHAHVAVHGRPRAVLVACFGDPGVWALREAAGLPVMGLAEAAMREAEALGPFAIVTGGAAWGPMLERLARGLQLLGRDRLRCVRTVEASGGELVADRVAGLRLLQGACEALLRDDAAVLDQGGVPLASVVLGGAALGGWAQALRASACPWMPVIDSVQAGARWLGKAL